MRGLKKEGDLLSAEKMNDASAVLCLKRVLFHLIFPILMHALLKLKMSVGDYDNECHCSADCYW